VGSRGNLVGRRSYLQRNVPASVKRTCVVSDGTRTTNISFARRSSSASPKHSTRNLEFLLNLEGCQAKPSSISFVVVTEAFQNRSFRVFNVHCFTPPRSCDMSPGISAAAHRIETPRIAGLREQARFHARPPNSQAHEDSTDVATIAPRLGLVNDKTERYCYDVKMSWGNCCVKASSPQQGRQFVE